MYKNKQTKNLQGKSNEYALMLVTYLQEQPESSDFLAPVDYKNLGMPWYPTIVKHPMDLSTVEHKITKHKYNSLKEVTKDIDLIWKNCKEVNQEESVSFK